MRVHELIELLQEYDQDLEVEFLGYACGQDFHQRVTPEDFRLRDIGPHDRQILEIQCDWN